MSKIKVIHIFIFINFSNDFEVKSLPHRGKSNPVDN